MTLLPRHRTPSRRLRAVPLPAALALAFAATVTAAGPAGAAGPWTDLVRADLDHIRATLAADHPGAVAGQDPDFARWLDRGYALAAARADSAASLADAHLILRQYIAGFADAHTHLNLHDQPRRLRWPGFVVAWRGGQLVVVDRAADWPGPLPPVGGELIACDGVPAAAALQRRVLRYHDTRRGLIAGPALHAPRLLVDDGSTLEPPPGRCTIRFAGRTQAWDLVWRPARTATLEERLDLAGERPPGPPRLTRPAPGEVWIHLPSFALGSDHATAMQAIVDSLPRLRGEELIVLDVRGNGGGSSAWGARMVRALWGDAVVDRAVARHLASTGGERPSSLWRATAANLASVRADLAHMRTDLGQDAAIVRVWSELAARMESALARGQAWVAQPGRDEVGTADLGADDGTVQVSAPGPAPPNPVAAAVVLLTDPVCASACLDFADALLLMPGVRHVGQQTGADTVYMDIRTEPLPSGLGRFSVARKVARGRSRGHNEPLEPLDVYPGDLGCTDAVRDWVRGIRPRN